MQLLGISGSEVRIMTGDGVTLNKLKAVVSNASFSRVWKFDYCE